MNLEKYLNHLEEQFKKSYTFSKEVAQKRDNKLIEGFIRKAEEELSFNDFYSIGNENILKYSGVIFGLEEKNYQFFYDMPLELSWKMHEIEKTTNSLIQESEEHKRLFDAYKLGAEHCLYSFVDDNFKYKQINNRIKFYHILNRLYEAKNESVMNLEVVSLVKKGESLMKSIVDIDKKLESVSFIKKNAFYATKQFLWAHQKGVYDNLSMYEVKAIYSKKVNEEIRNKVELLNKDFSYSDSGSTLRTIAL